MFLAHHHHLKKVITHCHFFKSQSGRNSRTLGKILLKGLENSMVYLGGKLLLHACSISFTCIAGGSQKLWILLGLGKKKDRSLTCKYSSSSGHLYLYSWVVCLHEHPMEPSTASVSSLSPFAFAAHPPPTF